MKIEQVFFPSICFSNLMNAIADRRARQKDVAHYYADLIRSGCEHGSEDIDWTKANVAIRARWPKGLLAVKKMAWKLHKERNK